MQEKLHKLKSLFIGTHTKHNRVLVPAICAVLAVVLLVTLVLTGVIGRSDGTTLNELKSAGVLKVALIEDSRPYGWETEEGTAVGIEVDLVRKVCDTIGVELEVKVVSAAKAYKGVEKGTYHLVAGGLSSSVATGHSLQYTNPYSEIHQMIVCKIDGGFENFNSLPTARLAVKTGTHAERLVSKQDYTYTAYASVEEALDAVRDDTADAVVLDRWVAEVALEGRTTSDTSGDLVMLGAAVATAGYSFAMAPGSDEVIDEINTIVSQLAADGELNRIFEAYDASYYSPY